MTKYRATIIRACSAGFGLLLVSMVASFPSYANDGEPQPDIEVSGDWSIRCSKTAQSNPCDAVQVLTENNSGKPILQVSLAALANAPDQMAIRMIVPLGIQVQRGVEIEHGEPGIASVALPISRCEPEGCYVEGLISDSVTADLSRPNEVHVAVYDRVGNRLRIPLSVKGLADALRVIDERNGIAFSTESK